MVVMLSVMNKTSEVSDMNEGVVVDEVKMNGEVKEGKVELKDEKMEEVFRVSDWEIDMEEVGVKDNEGEGLDEKKEVIFNRPFVSEFDSEYAMVDERAADRMSDAFGSEAEKAMSYGFEPGDMVWGKVKSHPWWPGHVLSEAFASLSVRKTKRVGHVLVAFFGDSSYGWFDPAELIPFDINYAEKSKQTSNKNFLRACDEAIDEASRRAALGLTCRCRNPFNFRPMNVRSHFAVDVGGYEPGAVYSVMQIKKARERFQPRDVLGFIQQLALMPMGFDRQNVDSIRNKALVFAFRNAAFEEFDETYAEAFGLQPERPKNDEKTMLDQIAKIPVRAPLSGPMVIAEALGEKKKSTSKSKIKEQPKKDKYLFKRREEASEPRSNNVVQGREGIPGTSSRKEGVTTVAPEDYVFQKRTPVPLSRTEVAVNQDRVGTTGKGVNINRAVPVEAADSVGTNFVDAQETLSRVSVLPVGSPVIESVAISRASVTQVPIEDGRLHSHKEMVLHDFSGGRVSGGAAVSTSVGLDALSGKSDMTGVVENSSKKLMPENRPMVDSKVEQSKLPVRSEDSDQGLEGAWKREILEPEAAPQLPISSQSPGVVPQTSDVGLVKKVKGVKRSAVDITSDKSEKKRKKKKESQSGTSSEPAPKRLKTSKEEGIPRKSAGKSIGISLATSEKSKLDSQQKNDGSSSTLLSTDSSLSEQTVDLASMVVDLPQVVTDMLDLALDPFYEIERDRFEVVRQVLLRFRSLVYQKSLDLSPASEAEILESLDSKPPSRTGVSEILPGEDGRGPHPKRPKHVARPDDPTKSGRKRSLSDRQEEKAAKRLKKLDQLKSITQRKADRQKIPEVQPERKDTNTTVQSKPKPKPKPKPTKHDVGKKQDSPAKVVEPGMLVLKFPQTTSVPSSNELKARFGRFGPLDHDLMRVFWKTNTCRVVYRNKAHAQAAYDHAIRNGSLFGHVKVNYILRDVGGGPVAVESEPVKWQVNGASDETPQFRPMAAGDSILGPRPTTLMQRTQQRNVQLKSCLKKPSGDEVVSSVSVPREVPRVKFLLVGEDSNRGEQLVSSSKGPNNNSTSADGGASSFAMDVNSKNLQKVIPKTLPPILPFPPRAQDMHETRATGHQVNVSHAYYSEAEPINFKSHFANIPAVPTMPPTTSSNNKKIDIAHQLLSLLMRCNDIVTDVKSSLGYLPYHSL
ncbi:hypothetical protein IFM89_032309 [Coptis chinensis]|uniref:PWWP domain-containing protein n=1 Tax=Coptis chinensis TaxID=261450 RepID=A0A835IFB6_9MAGN|nr:hypothetical protein IFM89_032309 [Coptis chinensis]